MSFLLQYQRDGLGGALPFREFRFEMLSASRRERVVLRAAVVFRGRPLRSDQLLQFEPMKRRIERSLSDLQCFFRQLLDALSDAPSMHRLQRQRFQDQEIQSS